MKVVIATMFALLISSISFGQVLVDGFDDEDINQELWQVEEWGTGPTVSATSGQLEIVIPANSEDGPFQSGATWSLFYGGLISRCQLDGDFDVSVDFELLDWPEENGVRVGITIVETTIPGYRGVSVVRQSLGVSEFPSYPREGFSANYFNPVFYDSNVNVGKLRIRRIGGSYSGFLWDNGSWVDFYFLNSGPAGSVFVSIRAWSHDYTFADQDVRIAFDNFTILEGNGCEGVVATEQSSWGQMKSMFR